MAPIERHREPAALVFLWNLFRLRRVHPAYGIWLALVLPFMLAGNLLWDSPAWFAIVPRLMGVL